ncbi:MAG: NAD regulator, partial [Brevundimonas sp.]
PSPLPDLPMASDHRRIVATALGRLRSKLKYRPVLFDLTPDTFTLSALQAAAEAVAGLSLHKQNFRRGVERAGLVQATGVFSSDTGGRPAELFRFVGADPLGGPAPGLTLPGQR